MKHSRAKPKKQGRAGAKLPHKMALARLLGAIDAAASDAEIDRIIGDLPRGAQALL